MEVLGSTMDSSASLINNFSEDDRYADDFEDDSSDTNIPSEVENDEDNDDDYDSQTIDNNIDDDNVVPYNEEVSDDDNDVTTRGGMDGMTDIPPPINSSATNFSSRPNYANAKKDLMPYDSSSENDEEVIIGHTIAEINTRSMNLEEVTTELRGDSMQTYTETKETVQVETFSMRAAGGANNELANNEEDDDDTEEEVLESQQEAATAAYNQQKQMAMNAMLKKRQAELQNAVNQDEDEDDDDDDEEDAEEIVEAQQEAAANVTAAAAAYQRQKQMAMNAMLQKRQAELQNGANEDDDDEDDDDDDEDEEQLVQSQQEAAAAAAAYQRQKQMAMNAMLKKRQAELQNAVNGDDDEDDDDDDDDDAEELIDSHQAAVAAAAAYNKQKQIAMNTMLKKRQAELQNAANENDDDEEDDDDDELDEAAMRAAMAQMKQRNEQLKRNLRAPAPPTTVANNEGEEEEETESEEYELDEDDEDEGGNSDNAELYALGDDDIDEYEENEDAENNGDDSDTEQLLEEGDENVDDGEQMYQAQQEQQKGRSSAGDNDEGDSTRNVDSVTNLLENALRSNKPLDANDVEGMIAALKLLKNNFDATQAASGGGDGGGDAVAQAKLQQLGDAVKKQQRQMSGIPPPGSRVPKPSASATSLNKQQENGKKGSVAKGQSHSDTHCLKTRRKSELDMRSGSAKFECRVQSSTPTSFNSERHLGHMNIVKRTPSESSKSRGPQRKNLSFSNERVREIERHNLILLKKIESQKASYKATGGKKKANTGPSANSAARLSSAAVNRKKAQRQIDLDNQHLKRKLEAINYRRTKL